jgi:hypothetical protein
MKKILLALTLCVVFTFTAMVSWNWAPQFAQLAHCPTWVFDCIAVVALFSALASPVIFNEGVKEFKGQQAR